MNIENLEEIYRQLHLIRAVEQHIVDVYETDVIKSPVHLSIGQEWVAVAACKNLLDGDAVINSYRGHATFLAKGGSLAGMIGELYGKTNGVARGKAGSMHLVDAEKGVLPCSAVVGTTIPVGVGWAFAQKFLRSSGGKRYSVTLSVFGDGATEEGCFSESLNYAALHKLPIVFLCENNGLAIHQPIEKRWATRKLTDRVATYGIETHSIEEGDFEGLLNICSKAYENIRKGDSRPVFIEVQVYRWLEHVGFRDDHDELYREQAALVLSKNNDPLKIIGDGLANSVRQAIEKENILLIQAAVEKAVRSPFPHKSELYENNYAPK